MLSRTVLRVLKDKKAENIVIIDLSEQVDWTDRFILCTARVDLHRKAIAEGVLEEIARVGIYPLGQSGVEDGSSWILLDYGETVLHIFSPESRAFYNLERMWGEENNIRVVE